MQRRKKAPPNAYWRGATLWGRIEVAGREIRWSLRTSDAAAAVALIAERKAVEEAAAKTGRGRVPWGAAVAAWAEHIVHHVAPTTVRRYATSLRILEPYLLGKFQDEIDRAMIADIVRRRRAVGATGATIRRDLTALSSVLDFCEAEEWREGNPALTVMKRVKEQRDPIVLPEPEAIRRVIRRAPGNFARLIEAAWLTGCRLNELVRAERKQLDHTRHQFTIIGKGRKRRTIDLSDAAYEVMRSIPPNLRTRALFWHSDGKHYENVSSRFAGMVRQEAKSAQQSGTEFRRFRFHDLRHRYAVDALKEGQSIYRVQKNLGHSSIKVTELYLDHLTPAEAERAKAGSAQMPEHMPGSGDTETVAV